MIRLIFWNIYRMPIELAVILIILTIVLWPFTKKLYSKKHIWKCTNLMIFICSIFGILAATVLARNNEAVELLLTPFHSFFEAQTQPEIYRSMFMNVLLFFPLGLTLPFALPEKWKRKALLAIVIAFMISIVIELIQFQYHLGRAETDDIICNTLGAAIGTISYQLSK